MSNVTQPSTTPGNAKYKKTKKGPLNFITPTYRPKQDDLYPQRMVDTSTTCYYCFTCILAKWAKWYKSVQYSMCVCVRLSAFFSVWRILMQSIIITLMNTACSYHLMHLLFTHIYLLPLIIALLGIVTSSSSSAFFLINRAKDPVSLRVSVLLLLLFLLLLLLKQWPIGHFAK